MDSKTDKLLLRIPEAGEIVGCGKSKAYELAANGEWQTVSTPFGRRVVRAALEEWVARKVAEQVR